MKYEEQIKRAKRYYAKFKMVSDGSMDVVISEETEDDIYAFFQNCYHIKDHLKNDSQYTKHTPRQIEDYVSNNLELSLCADICNGLKHLILTNPRSGAAPSVGQKIIKTTIMEPISGGPTDTDITSKMQLTIRHSGNDYDAFYIATKAIELWDNFTST